MHKSNKVAAAPPKTTGAGADDAMAAAGRPTRNTGQSSQSLQGPGKSDSKGSDFNDVIETDDHDIGTETYQTKCFRDELEKSLEEASSMHIA